MSAVGDFELFHEVDQSFDAFHGHGVVDAGAAAADQTVTLELGQTVGFGFGDELGIQLFARSAEDDVHSGTVGLGNRALEEAAVIKEVVELGSLGVVDFFDTGDTALSLDPVGKYNG